MRVLCMGDSITFGQHLPAWVTPWPSRIGAIGRGVCGETTRQALERFPREVQQDPPDIVVLQWGHNDANRWDSDHGLPRVSLAAYGANLFEMVDRCQAVGAKPVFCSITPTFKSERYDLSLIEYDASLRNVAAEMDVMLADVRSEFLDRGAGNLVMADGVHLTDAGHDLYATVVGSCIPTLVRA